MIKVKRHFKAAKVLVAPDLEYSSLCKQVGRVLDAIHKLNMIYMKGVGITLLKHAKTKRHDWLESCDQAKINQSRQNFRCLIK